MNNDACKVFAEPEQTIGTKHILLLPVTGRPKDWFSTQFAHVVWFINAKIANGLIKPSESI